MKLVITGNPGVGKHTVAKIIAERIGAELIDINSLAIEKNVIGKKTEKGLEIDVKKLRVILGRRLQARNDQVIAGHLAAYVLRPAGIGMVAVLRRSPYELESTLKKRGYTTAKITENLASEILGVSFYDSLKTFGKRRVIEIDATKSAPARTASEVLNALHKKPKRPAIDWLRLVSEKGDMRRFFEY